MKETTKGNCTYFRRQFPEILIEPEIAPKDLLKEWIKHKKECKSCSHLFEKLSYQQRKVEKLLQKMTPTEQDPIRMRKKKNSSLLDDLGICLSFAI